MNLKKDLAPLWLNIPSDTKSRLLHCLDSAVAEKQKKGGSVVFFRADDVGVPGPGFFKLISLFREHRIPLTMGVVPAWLTKTRWQVIVEECGRDHSLWCWIQHGWRHINHECRGKKMEFGPSRPFAHKRTDLKLGLQRLKYLMGDALVPAFAPPWNRCDEETLIAVREFGYAGLSRSVSAEPPAPAGIPEYGVTVDLHTRKEKIAEEGWQSLFKELRKSLANGFCGIMAHHQRMNDPAFAFLDLLLRLLKQNHHIQLVHLRTLIKEHGKR